MLSPTPETFKTMMDSRALPRLSGFSILRANGPEAAAFLQAQAMNDVLALAPGQWQWNGWLNPKGRLIALFALLRSAESEFLLVLPDFPAAELLPLLQRFVFRAKVRLQVCEALACAVDFAERSSADVTPPDVAIGDPDAGWTMDVSGEAGPRHLCLLPTSSTRIGIPDVEADQRWAALDIAHGLPRLPESQRETWTPQMLALDRLNAFSLKKGCYPGQEIVARTHYLGQAKRQMVRLDGDGLQVGLELQDEAGRAVGIVVSASSDGSKGLAVVAASVPILRLAAARTATVLPLAGGLARPL